MIRGVSAAAGSLFVIYLQQDGGATNPGVLVLIEYDSTDYIEQANFELELEPERYCCGIAAVEESVWICIAHYLSGNNSAIWEMDLDSGEIVDIHQAGEGLAEIEHTPQGLLLLSRYRVELLALTDDYSEWVMDIELPVTYRCRSTTPTAS